MIGQTNKFLLEWRENIRNVSDEDFQATKTAVRTALESTDGSLTDKALSLYSSEISSHRYVFDRQDRTIALFETITKSEFKAFFERTFFSGESARFELMLTANVHKDL